MEKHHVLISKRLWIDLQIFNIFADPVLHYSKMLTSSDIDINTNVQNMVFNDTVNNISFLSWRSIVLVEETGVPGENHRSVASRAYTLSHNVVSYITIHITII